MKRQQGFGVLGIVLAIVITGAVGCCFWYVWNRNQSDNNQQTNNSKQQISNDDKGSEATESTKEPVIPEGWILNQTSYGNIYFPGNEGDVSFLEKPDNQLEGVNNGLVSESKNYTLTIFDLSEPKIQFGFGGFNPCKIEASARTLSNTSATYSIGSETYTHESEYCKTETIDISGVRYIDFSNVYEARYSAGYLLINDSEKYGLLLQNGVYIDGACYIGEKNQKTCKESFEKHKSELRNFLETFNEANKGFIES